MGHDSSEGQVAEGGHVTRAVEVTLDPSPSQERWLRSYVGSMRVAYNWALEQVSDNVQVRRDERERGTPEDELTPALSWSAFSLAKRWREVRDETHPWHRDVSIHAFETGLRTWCGSAGTTPVRRPAQGAGREPSSRSGSGSTTAATAASSSTGT